MSLKLVLGHDEQNDEFNRRVIESVEFNTRCRSSERRDDIVNPIRGAMRNGNAETDSRAHRFFALLE